MNIQELRDLTQKEKLEGRSRPWGYRTLQRGPSIYITRALLPTRIHQDAVTAAGIVLGMLGALLLTQLSVTLKLAGLFLVYLNILSDKVDGELARARGTHSLKGIFLDELNHLIVPPLVFAGLAYGLLETAGIEQAFLALAILVGPIALATTRAMHNIIPALYTKKLLKGDNRFSDAFASAQTGADVTQTNAETTTRTLPIVLLPIRMLHQFQDLLVFILTIAILLIIDSVRASTPYISLSIYPYTGYATIFFAALYALIVIENAIKGYRSIEKKMSQIAARTKSS